MGPCLCGDPYCFFCGNYYSKDDLEDEEQNETEEKYHYLIERLEEYVQRLKDIGWTQKDFAAKLKDLLYNIDQNEVDEMVKKHFVEKLEDGSILYKDEFGTYKIWRNK